MKKVIILLVLVSVVSALFFITVTQQQTVSIRAPFLDTYSHLLTPASWQKWMPGLNRISETDSDKVIVKKDSNSFTINYPGQSLAVNTAGGAFNVTETGNNSAEYSYLVAPGKTTNQSSVTVYRFVNIVHYLAAMFTSPDFSETHIAGFKHFMETDSLYYGRNIFKTGVPGAYLIVSSKTVLTQNQFAEAANRYNLLSKCLQSNHLTQICPLIAQFSPTSKDSTFVKVGFFIDKETKSQGEIIFNRMPKAGPLYSALFTGRFANRGKAYASLREYYDRHRYQSAILPFETYLDNKLPTSDTSKVNIQINFSGFF